MEKKREEDYSQPQQHRLVSLSWPQWQRLGSHFVSITEQTRLLDSVLLDSTGLRDRGFRLDIGSLAADSAAAPPLCHDFVRLRLLNCRASPPETAAGETSTAALQQFESYAIFAYKSSSTSTLESLSKSLLEADSLARLVADRCAAANLSAIAKPWKHDTDCCDCGICHEDATAVLVTVDVLSVLRRLADDRSSSTFKYRSESRTVELLVPPGFELTESGDEELDAFTWWWR
ncbi:hypothetical protein BOX15_Mlig009454g1 [Macrostomum lignano]|uniref:Uncharacterized protein n=1 Tax=Macrostomum lignano TaxID=282301 RepID=A0A267EFN2_9PLAT|nr:hypothetical protein BOX15_Mlig009454g1 [Macrostomum lignano]